MAWEKLEKEEELNVPPPICVCAYNIIIIITSYTESTEVQNAQVAHAFILYSNKYYAPFTLTTIYLLLTFVGNGRQLNLHVARHTDKQTRITSDSS